MRPPKCTARVGGTFVLVHEMLAVRVLSEMLAQTKEAMLESLPAVYPLSHHMKCAYVEGISLARRASAVDFRYFTDVTAKHGWSGEIKASSFASAAARREDVATYKVFSKEYIQ